MGPPEDYTHIYIYMHIHVFIHTCKLIRLVLRAEAVQTKNFNGSSPTNSGPPPSRSHEECSRSYLGSAVEQILLREVL